VRAATRVLPLEGGRNFRDLGGYETQDGQHVKWGRLFRSGALARLTPSDYDSLSAFGIRVVCDFRSRAERADEPTRWRADPAPRFMAWDGAIQIMQRSIMEQKLRVRPPDIYVRPALGAFRTLHFFKAEEIYNTEAQPAKHELKRRLDELLATWENRSENTDV
jgi:predicted acylesterase/phospholipase RssA